MAKNYKLKLKSLVYRYTGVYLANKEEQKYMRSKPTQRRIKDLSAELGSGDAARGIVIGMWQAKHGFTRPWSPCQAWLWHPLSKLHISLLALKYDFQNLIRKIL